MLTIVTPAETTDLTTLAAVKSELGLTTADHDAQLADYISQVSTSVNSYCNRVFARETVAETFRPDCRLNHLVLSRFPVSAISSIVENGVELVVSDYELDADLGIARRLVSDSKSTWPSGKIIVTYAGGYLLPGDVGRDLPEDIERAAIMLAAQAFSSAGIDATVKRETVEGIGSTERFPLSASGMSPEAEALLSRYRQGPL